jgi:uncharacterized membrane protein
MTKNRVEALTDGVIAIAITIMVLELKVPQGTDIHAVVSILPELATYLVSFVRVGIYWNNHHHMFQSVKHVSGAVLWANLHLLFWLSLLPLGTEWIRNANFAGEPVGIYGLILLMAAIAYAILTMTLVKVNGPNSEFAKALGSDIKGRVSVGLYVLALAVFYWLPYVSCAIYILVAAMWFVPDRRFARHQVHED